MAERSKATGIQMHASEQPTETQDSTTSTQRQSSVETNTIRIRSQEVVIAPEQHQPTPTEQNLKATPCTSTKGLSTFHVN